MNQNINKIYGYARVSTKEQKHDLQIIAINKKAKEFGIIPIIECDKISSTKKRIGLEEILNMLKPNDLLIIWRYDRLARSLVDLLNIVNKIKQKKANFYSIEDNVDTSTANGEFMFNIYASLAQFQKRLLSERTKAGLNAAILNGVKLGRRKGLYGIANKNKNNIELCAKNYQEGLSIADLSRKFKKTRTTIYKWLAFLNIKLRQ